MASNCQKGITKSTKVCSKLSNTAAWIQQEETKEETKEESVMSINQNGDNLGDRYMGRSSRRKRRSE